MGTESGGPEVRGPNESQPKIGSNLAEIFTFKYLKSFRQFLRMWWNGLHWILFMYVPYALSLCKSWPNLLSHMILFVILGLQSLVNIFL